MSLTNVTLFAASLAIEWVGPGEPGPRHHFKVILKKIKRYIDMIDSESLDF